MRLSEKKYFDDTQLNNIEDVLESLQLLEHDLSRMGLRYLSNFNYTYLIITRNVRQALRKGLFTDESFLNQFDGRFAYYYTHAIHEFLEHASVAPAWRVAFEKAKLEQESPLTTMALGVNVHVNNDIPQVLLDCRATGKHYEDYLVINGIIGSSLEEVIDELDDDARLTNPKTPVLNPAYKLVMKKMVKEWRQDTWNKYEDLQNQGISVKEIEQAAYKKTEQILALPI